MGRSFPGGGSTDRLAYDAVDGSNQQTLSCWTKRTDDGNTVGRRFIEQRDGSALPRCTFIVNNNSVSTYKFHHYTSAGVLDGRWYWTWPTINVWTHVVITYDGSSTANNPVAYHNGVSQTITEEVAPTAVWATTQGTHYIGNNLGNTGSLNGEIKDMAIWSEILSTSEISALVKGVSPFAIRPTKLLLNIPLWGLAGEPDVAKGKTATIVGSTGTVSPVPASPFYPQQ